MSAPGISDDFAALLDSIRLGQPPPMTAERRALAEAAAQANGSRRGENIDTWAHHLASIVAGANEDEYI